MAFSKPTYNFMLLGKTGCGKSSTGNTLINREKVFKASNQAGSCTKVPQLECGSFDNYIIKVVDTPGLMDTNIDMTVTLDNIGNAMGLLPDGFDALLLVMRYGDRCTKEVIEVITALRASFGEIFAKEYCIIVMTHGESFDADMGDEECPYTFYDYCQKIREPPELLTLLRDCDDRVVLFYNKTNAKLEDNINTLLQLVQRRRHRSQRYNSQIFAQFANERNKYVIGLNLPQLRPAIQEKLSFLNEELEKSIENPDAKSDLKIKRKAQQLLDTIEVESGGTSLMDDLKTDVRRFISTVDALASQNEERRQKEEQREKQEQKRREKHQHQLQELRNVVEKQKQKQREKHQQQLQEFRNEVENIKDPPSSGSPIRSGLWTLVCFLSGSACSAAALFNPFFLVPAAASFVGTIAFASNSNKE